LSEHAATAVAAATQTTVAITRESLIGHLHRLVRIPRRGAKYVKVDA
jgi:hypothetical protein